MAVASPATTILRLC